MAVSASVRRRVYSKRPRPLTVRVKVALLPGVRVWVMFTPLPVSRAVQAAPVAETGIYTVTLSVAASAPYTTAMIRQAASSRAIPLPRRPVVAFMVLCFLSCVCQKGAFPGQRRVRVPNTTSRLSAVSP